jgi:hypothetical protein
MHPRPLSDTPPQSGLTSLRVVGMWLPGEPCFLVVRLMCRPTRCRSLPKPLFYFFVRVASHPCVCGIQAPLFSKSPVPGGVDSPVHSPVLSPTHDGASGLPLGAGAVNADAVNRIRGALSIMLSHAHADVSAVPLDCVPPPTPGFAPLLAREPAPLASPSLLPVHPTDAGGDVTPPAGADSGGDVGEGEGEGGGDGNGNGAGAGASPMRWTLPPPTPASSDPPAAVQTVWVVGSALVSVELGHGKQCRLTVRSPAGAVAWLMQLGGHGLAHAVAVLPPVPVPGPGPARGTQARGGSSLASSPASSAAHPVATPGVAATAAGDAAAAALPSAAAAAGVDGAPSSPGVVAQRCPSAQSGVPEPATVAPVLPGPVPCAPDARGRAGSNGTGVLAEPAVAARRGLFMPALSLPSSILGGEASAAPPVAQNVSGPADAAGALADGGGAAAVAPQASPPLPGSGRGAFLSASVPLKPNVSAGSPPRLSLEEPPGLLRGNSAGAGGGGGGGGVGGGLLPPALLSPGRSRALSSLNVSLGPRRRLAVPGSVPDGGPVPAGSVALAATASGSNAAVLGAPLPLLAGTWGRLSAPSLAAQGHNDGVLEVEGVAAGVGVGPAAVAAPAAPAAVGTAAADPTLFALSGAFDDPSSLRFTGTPSPLMGPMPAPRLHGVNQSPARCVGPCTSCVFRCA